MCVITHKKKIIITTTTINRPAVSSLRRTESSSREFAFYNFAFCFRYRGLIDFSIKCSRSSRFAQNRFNSPRRIVSVSGRLSPMSSHCRRRKGNLFCHQRFESSVAREKLTQLLRPIWNTAKERYSSKLIAVSTTRCAGTTRGSKSPVAFSRDGMLSDEPLFPSFGIATIVPLDAITNG